RLTSRTSPPRAELLRAGERSERWQVRKAQELHLVTELDAELLERTPTRLDHQRHRVPAARVARVLDEVRMLGRDLGAADPEPLQPAGVEHAPGGELVLGVLEDAAEGSPVRGLCGLPPGLKLAHGPPDVVRGPRFEPELHPGDHAA